LTNGPVSLCSRDERSSPVRSSPVQSSWTNGQAGWTIPSARDERPDERSSCPSTMPKVPSTSTVLSTSSVEGLRRATRRSRDERSSQAQSSRAGRTVPSRSVRGMNDQAGWTTPIRPLGTNGWTNGPVKLDERSSQAGRTPVRPSGANGGHGLSALEGRQDIQRTRYAGGFMQEVNFKLRSRTGCSPHKTWDFASPITWAPQRVSGTFAFVSRGDLLKYSTRIADVEFYQ